MKIQFPAHAPRYPGGGGGEYRILDTKHTRNNRQNVEDLKHFQ